jgi:hypothetical protein
MRWLIIAAVLILVGRQLNLAYCHYCQQYAGPLTDVIPFPPGWRSSIGDWMQLGGLATGVYYFLRQMLIVRKVK